MSCHHDFIGTWSSFFDAGEWETARPSQLSVDQPHHLVTLDEFLFLGMTDARVATETEVHVPPKHWENNRRRHIASVSDMGYVSPTADLLLTGRFPVESQHSKPLKHHSIQEWWKMFQSHRKEDDDWMTATGMWFLDASTRIRAYPVAILFSRSTATRCVALGWSFPSGMPAVRRAAGHWLRSCPRRPCEKVAARRRAHLTFFRKRRQCCGRCCGALRLCAPLQKLPQISVAIAGFLETLLALVGPVPLTPSKL